jgi:hypothetical protein
LNKYEVVIMGFGHTRQISSSVGSEVPKMDIERKRERTF